MSLTNDAQPAFPITQDLTTKEGIVLTSAVENDAAAGRQSVGILTGKDPSGNLRYLKVNSSGELVVITESEELACLSAAAKVGGHTTTEQEVLSITLQASTVYKKIGWLVSCFRQAEFRICHIDDEGGVGETENELATLLVGAGDFTDSGELECLNFTSGAVGTQSLKVYGLNKDAVSDLRATLSVLEVQ